MGRCAAIVLAAGTGSRMKSDIPKQYLPLDGRPVIYYSLKAFEESAVDEIVLVAGVDDIAFCKNEIVGKYHFHKVTQIVPGGRERYDSVFEGLRALRDVDYVLIHDGARPMLTQDIIARSLVCVKEENACVAGMPVKDTIKVVDDALYASVTPDRSHLWLVQTPQSFSGELLRRAYETLHRRQAAGESIRGITDDAMLVEQMTGVQAKLIEGSYENIKITTPEDLDVADVFLKKMKKSVDTVRQ
jgi:2-C-methyl-D-erythritol 4-phosphate cytidylyltransferase